MSQIEYIITEFGLGRVNAKLYKPGATVQQQQADEFTLSDTPDIVERMDPNQPEIVSWLGTPVFDRLTLTDPVSELSIDVDTVLFEVTQKRDIVVTKVQGLSDTVKEHISNGDFQVTIHGVLLNINATKYPFDQMNTLIRLCSVNNELDCVSDFLSIFNIYHLVVVKADFKQSPGKQNFQRFQLECLSDNPVELKVEEQG